MTSTAIPLACAIASPFFYGLMNMIDKYAVSHKAKDFIYAFGLKAVISF